MVYALSRLHVAENDESAFSITYFLNLKNLVTGSHYFRLDVHDLYPASEEASFLSLVRKLQDMNFSLFLSLPLPV